MTISFILFFIRSDETECREFFSIITSKAYEEAKKETPIQFVRKINSGSHQGDGIHLLDQTLEDEIKVQFKNGALCDVLKQNSIMQKYISNTLTVYDNNKFDFRIYVLIASTNPLIAFYHDGFLRSALYSYDPKRTEVQSNPPIILT